MIETNLVFCSLYSNRSSHFFNTPTAGGPVDKSRSTQVGVRCRSWESRQNRLPHELRVAGIKTLEGANPFLQEWGAPGAALYNMRNYAQESAARK